MANLLRSPLPYFGSVALWRTGVAAGGFCWLASEHYQRRSERNRCAVLGPNGPHTLSIPLLAGKHEQAAIQEVRISYSQDWRRVHWGTLKAGYGSAPFWQEYAPSLQALYGTQPTYLWDWNVACINWISEQLNGQVLLVLAKAEDWSQADANVKLTDCSKLAPYSQVFADRLGFVAEISVLDLLLCQGPAAGRYLTAPQL